MKVVGIGGGTGLPVLLSGLKELLERGECDVEVTALVAVSDSGGSSGDLRRTLGIPALGDLRNCLIALGDLPPVLKAVCQHRFEKLDGWAGHSVGNMVLSALYQMSGDFEGMVRLASDLFRLKGSVLPSTAEPVTLCAEFADGTTIRGESNIPLKRRPIRRVWLEPEHPRPACEVLKTLAAADVIVFGPGSLFTSIIPNLLVTGVAEAIHASRATKVYVCNLMTQYGETEGLGAADHLRILQSYLPPQTIDICVVNTRPAGPLLAQRYSRGGAHFVPVSAEHVRQLGVSFHGAELLQEKNDKVRHDPIALARLITQLTERRKEMEAVCAES
jgi:uncharacterized cofD-like protein